MDTYSDKYIFGESTVTNDTELTTSGYRVASSVIYSDNKELSMDKFIYSSEELQLSMTGSKLSFWSTNSVN
ncbi:hypothetical protein I3271_04480 [Photobacterium leiognathi]|uniref:hypothetical protein n=1 Tax=Photobacterium leiognathi TaxID=553611 RepID=UPI001EDDA409|nr:hypothetical protein [Photobacterium leiognathi]MCG3883940.1 hypothetical protein [Photobacterium leiognathi]